MVDGTSASPCRPRSARYAEKGYPNYAEDEPGERRGPCGRNGCDGGRAKEPAMRGGRGRKRRTNALGKVTPLVLQGEEAVALEEGRKKRPRTGGDAPVGATPADKVFASFEVGEGDMAPVNGVGVADEPGVDERGGKSWRLRVKETLRLFSSNYLHFVQEEQRRADAVNQELKASRALKSKIPADDGKIKHVAKQHVKRGQNKGSTRGRKPKGNNLANGRSHEKKRPSKRPDLKTLTKMQESGAVLNREKMIGHVHGIDVGDQFCSRAEMVALGIHSHWLYGIDYMGAKYRDKKGCEDFTFPFATCIVMSGIYQDDFDNADEIIYTGQGGNNWLGNRHQKTEQSLLRGNLALKNSKDNGNPIRVIRGHIEKRSYTGKVYTYDGLYKVRFTRGNVRISISELPGLVCGDISNGQENIPIPATNLVDNPPVPPPGTLQTFKDASYPLLLALLYIGRTGEVPQRVAVRNLGSGLETPAPGRRRGSYRQ